MLHVFQRSDALGDQIVALDAFDMGQETDATRIFFVVRIVKPLLRRKRGPEHVVLWCDRFGASTERT